MINYMRNLFLLLFLSCLAKPTYSQIYAIYGPTKIYLCEFQDAFYRIETDEELMGTQWAITPIGAANITSQGINSASVVFFAPGTYILTATSFTLNQEILVDSIEILVYGIHLDPTIIGCYEIDPTKGCYKVCANSETQIYFFHPDVVEWEVTGAESYIITAQNSLIITWGPGGPGSVTLYSGTGQNCDLTLCFDILPMPVAAFSTTPSSTGDTLTVCKNQEIFFENESFNGVSYNWIFGDGDQTEGYDVTHTYNQEGFYTVTLQANNIC